MATINGHFFYACIQTPKKKYESEDMEYSVNVLISEEDAKVWNKQFKKQKAKVLDLEDFEKQYKAAPEGYEGEDFNVITLKTNANYPDGTPMGDKAPKVYMKNSKGKLEDVTKTTLVGNGSQGAAQYNVIENKYGTFAKLSGGLRVDVLVPYVGGGSSVDELGELDNTAGELSGNPLDDIEDTPVVSKPKARKAKATIEDDDDADPFA